MGPHSSSAGLPQRLVWSSVQSTVAAIIGVVLGFLGAVVLEPLQREWLGADIDLHFYNARDCISVAGDVKVVRVRVRNTAKRMARSVRPYLTNVEELNAEGRWVRTDYCDSIQLAWSVHDDSPYEPIDIPYGVTQFVDVLWWHKGDRNYNPQIRLMPKRYASLWQVTKALRFTIHVTGDQLEPRSIRLIVRGGGTWEGLTVSEDPTDT